MKVLIIDNQFNQYKDLRTCLKKNRYDFVPSGDEEELVHREYVSLLSSIKVYIYKPKTDEDESSDENEKRNEDAYRKKAWDVIMESVNKSDLIIMDFRLGSPLTSMSGLEVAEDIWKEKNIPILILSRDEQSREDIKAKWTDVKTRNYSRTDWEVKGYWGSQLLPEDFIVSVIIPAIESLYAKWKVVKPITMIKREQLALSLSYFENYDFGLLNRSGPFDQFYTLMSKENSCPMNSTFDSIYDYFVTRNNKTITDEIIEAIEKYVTDYLSGVSV